MNVSQCVSLALDQAMIRPVLRPVDLHTTVLVVTRGTDEHLAYTPRGSASQEHVATNTGTYPCNPRSTSTAGRRPPRT